MDSRREFLRKAALLAGGGGLAGVLPGSIQRAFAIDPPAGSTWLDAEHVVILMQENRSFDHAYGSLRGVRGYNDPRAITLPDGNPVWLQTNKAGDTYAPFRLNIKDTKATWMSSLPHSWTNQTDARNEGKHDGWLDAKPSSHKEYANLPLTMGFYNREDIPFYYSLADAFTVCDQNFCSSLTGTTPNRLHLWTGTIRKEQSIHVKANVRNEDVDYGAEASWTTFPERLEDAGISWRVYQNELSLPMGWTSEYERWLANFTDNPLEWFTQYQVRFSPGYRQALPGREKAISAELANLEAEPHPWAEAMAKKIRGKRAELEHVRREMERKTDENFAKLPVRNQNLHRKAFTTNEGDPDYHELTSLTYQDSGVERHMQVPKGDVLHRFREDVRNGKLPTVSWIVAPENFSDHPGAPWYGAWYISETLDILTRNPEVWKKTILILCYDENDGYFDHVPPFVPPHPDKPETGKVSIGIDTSPEHVRIEQELRRTHHEAEGRTGPIGLGFRVPLVIASPWTRGGYVCSQVFDHTSILQLLERLLTHKYGRKIRETNISAWRRTVCGDLSSVFRPYNGEKIDLPVPVQQEAFLGSIHQAQFKPVPNGFKKLNSPEVAQARENPKLSPWLPKQEAGIRPSCALPYELAVDGATAADGASFAIRFSAGKGLFGDKAVGAPFHVYAPGKMQAGKQDPSLFEIGRTWAYAVAVGDNLEYTWPFADFENGICHLCAHGANGFYREFRSSKDDAALEMRLEVDRTDSTPSGNAILHLSCRGQVLPIAVEIEDVSYGSGKRTVALDGSSTAAATASIALELRASHGWYDFRVTLKGNAVFKRRYAGRIETGQDGISDPLMG